MSREYGYRIRCTNWIDCHNEIFDTYGEANALERFGLCRWTTTEDGRDFCLGCSERRAARKKVSEIVPPGTTLYTAFDALEAAGFAKMYETEDGEAHFFCCGKEVETTGFLGSATGAKCSICGTTVVDVTGPSFGRSTVSFADPDKVDTEDPVCWVILGDLPTPTEATP